ncbi:MAG: hypothetical protein FJY10_05510 [Bacteroidetes bacterium]|nr:hypothetical protein [Bacteroidota bacterium]
MKIKKKQNTKKIETKFQSAVKKTVEVKSCYQVGLQAMKPDERRKINLADNNKCGGSLFIDKCLIDQNKYPNDNRWDYAIDYDGEIFFIEFHSAMTGEVDTVVKKYEWLKVWLRTKAPELNKLKAKSKHPYYWIQSSGFHIPYHSSQYRRIVQMNLRPRSKLILN